MEIAKVTKNGESHYTNDIEAAQKRAENDAECSIEIIEMTEEEYKKIPASLNTISFFDV